MWIVVALAGVHGRISAQTAVDGAIGGTIEDRSGAVVSAATIIIHNNSTNAEETATADGSGFFRAIHLQPGIYTVTVNASGFEVYKAENITVTVGSLTDVEPRMVVGSTAETVEVSSAPPAINTTNNDFTSVVDQKELEDLPVNNYRWSAYALQSPGVVESGGFGLLSFRGQSTLLNNITVDGADDNQAFFSEERGRTFVGYSTPKSAIQEFQINLSNYSTEYGRASGAVVNAVTKSGSNQFHGEGYWLDRDSALAAFNNFTTENIQQTPGGPFISTPIKPTDIRKQDGFAIGGPILRDKLFFFFALDRYYRRFPIVTVPSSPATFFAVPNASLPGGTQCPGTGVTNPITAANDKNFTADNNACTLQSQLKLPTYSAAATDYINGQASLGSLLGEAPRFADQTLFFPKIDWQINARNHFSGEANRLRFISPGGQQTNATAQYGTQSIGNLYGRVTWGVGRLDTTITNSLANEIRYQYGRDFEPSGPEKPTAYEQNTLLTPQGYTNPFGIPPNVFISGAFQFGTATFYPRLAYPDERRWQVSDTANYVRGNHTIKFGIDYIHTNDLAENIPNLYGAYSYTSVVNYLTDYYQLQNPATVGLLGHYSTYNQGFGQLAFDFNTSDYAGFIQDEWKILPRLSLTFGARYEYEQSPNAQIPNPAVPQTSSFPSDKNNIAPRVGFAFNVFGTGKTVLRGGYGIFNARLINSTIYNALTQTAATNAAGAPLGQLQSPNLTPSGSTVTVNGVSTIINKGPIFPQIASGSAGVTPNVIYFDPHFQLPQIHQVDLAVDQDLGWNTVLSVSYLGSFGRELPTFQDTNLPAPVKVVYNVVNTTPTAFAALQNGAQFTTNLYGGARPNSNYGGLTDIVSNVNTSYNALVAQIQHRLNRNIQFQGSYTWSHVLDYNENNTTFSSTSAILDPLNPRLEYGNGNQNVPNRFIATAVATSPWKASGWKSYLVNGYELSPSFSAQNGAPYSANITGNPTNLVTTTGATITGVSSGYTGTGGGTIVPGLGRNVFNQPRTILLDLRGSKRFQIRERYNLEFLAESFNLANHQNVTAVNTTAYTLGTSGTGAAKINTLTQFTGSVFGATTNSNNNNIYTPRQIQLGVRLQF